MGLGGLKLFGRKGKQEARTSFSDLVFQDAKLVVELLKNSPFLCSMDLMILKQRFSMAANQQGDAINGRVVGALKFLNKYRVLEWSGGGCVIFDRNRLFVPVVEVQ